MALEPSVAANAESRKRVHSHKCSCNIIWHHCLLHKNDPQQHLLKRKREVPPKKNERPRNNRDSQASTRVAPDIEDGNPSKAKRPSFQIRNRPLQGQMLDMQLKKKMKQKTLLIREDATGKKE